jgi:hypothetical protein
VAGYVKRKWQTYSARRMLAKLGRVDMELLAPIRHRGAETQADLAVARGRDGLVADKTLIWAEHNRIAPLSHIKTGTCIF